MIKAAESAWQVLWRFLVRFRYPATLPQDIAEDLGVSLSNSLTFEQFVGRLCSRSCIPTTLTKFMPREEAEKAFQSALRKERFHANTLYSYYFHEGWLEFMLQFDDQSRLRRLYLQHRYITQDRGIEIPLHTDKNCAPSP